MSDYLENLLTGDLDFYHVTFGDVVYFDKPKLSFFSMLRDASLRIFGLDPSAPSYGTNRESDIFSVCELRFRNLNWDDVFDIGQCIDDISSTVDASTGLKDVTLNAMGKQIEELTDFKVESYSFANFMNYRVRNGEHLITSLNRLFGHKFVGFIEDESPTLQPMYNLDRSEAPKTLALDFSKRDIVVEVMRHQVVDGRGHIVKEDTTPQIFYPYRYKRKNK